MHKTKEHSPTDTTQMNSPIVNHPKDRQDVIEIRQTSGKKFNETSEIRPQ